MAIQNLKKINATNFSFEQEQVIVAHVAVRSLPRMVKRRALLAARLAAVDEIIAAAKAAGVSEVEEKAQE